MSTSVFKIKHIDHGYCRILFEVTNDEGQSIYYCIQE